MTFMHHAADPNHGGGDPTAGDLSQEIPLRHILVGSPNRVSLAINFLHIHRYTDYRLWSPLHPLPPDGLIIRATPEQVFAYLELKKRFTPG